MEYSDIKENITKCEVEISDNKERYLHFFVEFFEIMGI